MIFKYFLNFIIRIENKIKKIRGLNVFNSYSLLIGVYNYGLKFLRIFCR